MLFVFYSVLSVVINLPFITISCLYLPNDDFWSIVLELSSNIYNVWIESERSASMGIMR